MTEEPKRYRGQRGPNRVKKDSMKLVAIRLPQHVVDYYKGCTPLMRSVLIEFMDNNPNKTTELTEADYEAIRKWRD